jgi:hypothetical protein
MATPRQSAGMSLDAVIAASAVGSFSEVTVTRVQTLTLSQPRQPPEMME